MIDFDEYEASHGQSVQERVTGTIYLTEEIEEIEEWVDQQPGQ